MEIYQVKVEKLEFSTGRPCGYEQVAIVSNKDKAEEIVKKVKDKYQKRYLEYGEIEIEYLGLLTE